MRIAITIFLIILVVVIIAGIYFLYAMQKPLYEPGMVRDGKNLRAPLTPPKQPAVLDFWIVEDDIQLYHFSKGTGKNVLIIHGGPGFPFSEPWPGLDTLAGDYQFHYYDQRGCGKSSRPIDKFNSTNYYKNMTSLDKILGLGAQVADIERIRRILGDDKLIIIGHSFGAFLASLYAAEFPEHVEAMVMVTPAPMFVLPMEVEGLFEIIQKRLPDNMQENYNKWYKNYFDFKNIFSKTEADLVALNKKLAGFFSEATQISMPFQGEPGGWMVHAMYLSMGQRHDYRDALNTVDVPVLVIHAAEDFQTEAASRIYNKVFSNSRFYNIENSGHMPFYEQPDEFSSVIAEFLGNLK